LEKATHNQNNNNTQDNIEIQENAILTEIETDIIEEVSHEETTKHIRLERNIVKRILMILLAGIVYLFIRVFSKNSDETYQFVDFIVIITTLIGLISTGIYAKSIINQRKSTKEHRNYVSSVSLPNKKRLYDIIDVIAIIPVCAVIVTFVFAFVFIFPVSGPSMNPNVQNGEKMLAVVSNQVERFDMVVIQIDPKFYDHSVRERFLKRIIGLPGDTLAHNGTQLFINNIIVEEPFLLDEFGNLKKDIYGNYYSTPSFHFVPSNSNKVCRTIINGVETICPIDGNVMIIPEGYYFVLGDNRPNSKDSPELGLIRQEDIIGIVKYHIHSLIHWEKVE
jgi:signal peptidase I